VGEAGDRHPFPTTHWSQVALAGLPDGEGGRRALEDLLRRYLPALGSYLRIQEGLPPDRADDLLQSFVSDKVLEADLIARADRRRGKFRTFLLVALHRYVLDRGRREGARKRIADRPSLSIDEIPEDAATIEPCRVLDVAWARETIAAALQSMRRECDAGGRPEIWGAFEGRVLGPILDGTPAITCEELAARFGFRSAVQASNALVTAKRTFARHLRAVIGQYADDEGEVDAEIAALRGALAAADR
jgi:DNA-directed RNA polymerase specialized sigma24 family protein